MKVLITGAAGLLGSRMRKVFPSDWDLTCADKQAAPGVECVCMEDRHSVRRALRAGGYDWVVHCAAVRSPEACEEDPRMAMEINAKATGWLARSAADAGARPAYASSHHVFSGENPPYREEDTPSPLSVYGQTKLAGERHVLGVPGSLVVRLPALYSLDPDAPNGKILDLKRSVEAGRPVGTDAGHLRYYTLAEEAAAAFAFLMANDCRGVVHVSAAKGCTELEFSKAATGAMGLDSDLVVEGQDAPSRVQRPRDSRLDTALYGSLGGPSMTDYDVALRAHAENLA